MKALFPLKLPWLHTPVRDWGDALLRLVAAVVALTMYVAAMCIVYFFLSAAGFVFSFEAHVVGIATGIGFLLGRWSRS